MNLLRARAGARCVRHDLIKIRIKMYTGIYSIKLDTTAPATTVLLNFVKATKGMSSKAA